MGSSMLNIGVTGLNAAQAGLLTTGHNITNAATPGYTRQGIVQTTNTPQFTGAGFFGQGVNVATVKRIYSQFLSNQVATAQSSTAQLQTYANHIAQIDNLLADTSVGLSPALQDFFRGVQEVAANPASVPARQSLLSAGEALAARMNSLDARLTELREGVNLQITSAVTGINAMAAEIADLNEGIISAQAAAAGQPANDLLDRRDRLIADLNREIRVSTNAEANGSINVFVGNGQPLVVGTKSASLQAVQDVLDPSRIVVGMRLPTGGTMQLLESMLGGGNLGGLIAFRSQSLDTVQNALGRVAIGITETVNAQHRLGQDLYGALGGDFFRPLTTTVVEATSNAGNADLDASIVDHAALTSSDYRIVAVTGGNFDITRLADGVRVYSGSLSPPPTLDGFTVSLASGAATLGDSFILLPTRTSARNFGVAISDTRAIAAAAPLRTAAALSNTGNANVSEARVSATGALPLGSVTLSFDAGPPEHFTGFPAGTTVTVNDRGTLTTYAAVTPATPVAYAAGATISFDGVSFEVAGTPRTGDRFSVADNTNGVSDNRNMLALGGLQTAKLMLGGTASYQSAYSQLVSDVGNRARQTEVNLQAQQNLEKQAVDAQQSLSGVNLDEEAANLLRYQQAYQAAGKMIEVASRLFDELLAIGR